MAALTPLQTLIADESLNVGVNPALGMALSHWESGGMNPNAVSPTGVTGLFQVTNATGGAYGQTPQTRTDPQVSARAGLGYFRDLLDQHQGNVPQALAAYNGGSDPHFAQRVLSVYPQYAQYETLQRGRPPVQGAQAGAVDLDAIDAGLRQEWQGKAAQVEPGSSPAPGGVNLDQIDAQLRQEWQQGSPPGGGAAPSAGGFPMTIDIEKPSTGNPPGAPAVARRRQPENLDAGIDQALAPSAFNWRQAAAMGINVGSAAFGAIGGTGLGALTSPVTGPVGPIAGAIGGEALGSFAGHKINQGLGLEAGDPKTFDPTLLPPSGDVLSLGVPLAVRGAGAVGPALAKRLPGAPAMLHEEAVAGLEALPGRFAPARPAADLYAELAAGSNPTIPAANLTLRATEIAKQELALQPTLRNKAILGVANDLQDLARQYRGNIPIEHLYAHQQRLGLLVREAQKGAWPQEAGLKRLYGAIYSDIDQAVAHDVPEAATLRQATQAARREFAQDDLAALFQPGSPGMTTRPDGLVQVNGGRLLDRFNRKLTTDKTFADSFTRPEQVEIQDLLHDMTKLPRIPPPKGQTFGSGGVLVHGGLTYVLTHAVTGNPQLAAAAGTLAATAPPLIAKAIMTPTGRQLLRQYLQAGQIIGPAELAALRSATTLGPGAAQEAGPRP